MPSYDEPESPSRLIDGRIKELPHWQGRDAVPDPPPHPAGRPDVVEEWKWAGVPVWSHDGMICARETYSNQVKITFAEGAALEDPAGPFNASLEG